MFGSNVTRQVLRRWQCSAFSSYVPQFGGNISWFPGHMAKAIDIVKLKVAECDAVLEIRDARVRPWLGQEMSSHPFSDTFWLAGAAVFHNTPH